MRLRPNYLCLCAAWVLWASLTFAQVTSGNIAGIVYDPTGGTIPSATVKATNMATGIVSSTVSTAIGEYRLPNLPVGNYTISVSAPGFAAARVANLAVPLNQTVTANVTLQVGQAVTTIEVNTSAAAIDTSTAQVQNTFNTKEMMDLPVASVSAPGQGSGVLNLSLLNAGVATSGGVGYGTGPSIGGQRPNNNNFTIEGIDINSKSVTGPVVTVPNDAVAQFTVLQNQFSPEFGHSSGGQFNEVVKSGSNTFHGEAYDYFENRDLNAADNLDFVEGNPLHPRYDNNRFGGNFGGPIVRNRLFFFGDYEYNPIGQTASTYYFVPTAAGYSTLAAMPGINQNNLTQLQKYLGVAPSAASTSQLPFGQAVQVGPGNESLGTGAWATGSGLTTIPVGEISESLPAYTNNEFGVASVDYDMSDRDTMRGRFVLNRTGSIDTSGFPSQFFTTVPTNSYVVTYSEYHTFSPTLVNEFRLGYNRLNQTFGVPNTQFPGLDEFPNIDVFELNAAYGPDPNAPQYTIQNTYELSEDLSWTHGAHSFKFGFDGWKSISPQNFLQRSRGDYEWSYLSDYLFDNYPDGIAERSIGSGVYSGDQYLLGWYGNDSWKIRPNLTVNLGLRYEYETVPYTERLQSLNSDASVPGLIEFNEPQPQKTDFMPRIGVAWSPGTSGKTSIRAGFGRNYDVLFDNLGILSEPPVFNTTVDVTGRDAAGFLANGGIPASSFAPPTDAADARANTSGFVPNQKRPEAIQWNFGIQHVFGNNYTFESRYLGSRGINLPMQVILNFQPVVNSSNALPTYLTAPSQATLDALPNTLTSLQNTFDNGGYLVPAYANAGFTSPIYAFMPVGNSTYHGFANQLSRRFSNGLQFLGSYTWSHNIDDSTAPVFSTITTPRRPQDFQDLQPERASSALDHRQRLSFEAIYDVPFFKQSNWFMKNVVGNWELAPIFTYQTGTLVTVQSATDANMNGDSWPDRAIINPSGNPAIGSGVTPLTNSNGDVVAYLADNPNAGYIQAGKGTIATGGRNTMHLNPIDDIDMSATKRVNVTERVSMEFSARVVNLFNHPQYIGGFLSDVAPDSITGNLQREVLEPQTTIFDMASQGYSSNPRFMQLALKLIF
jgi:Carboxypeptidase regulatory-like domain